MAQARGKSGSKRKPAKRSAAPARSPFWPWLAALGAVAAGIVVYDHVPAAKNLLAGLTSEKPFSVAAKQESAPERPVPPKPVETVLHRPVTAIPTPAPGVAPDQYHTAGIIPPAPIGRPRQEVPLEPAAPLPISLPADAGALAASPVSLGGEKLAGAFEGKFFLCGTAKQDDCVVSADRFVFHGQKIRLVGIEVPDIKKPKCEAERIKASDAELRVRAFLDSGPFELVTWQGNTGEVEGHKLRAVTRNGRSLADILVSEGLAKRPGSKGWCG